MEVAISLVNKVLLLRSQDEISLLSIWSWLDLHTGRLEVKIALRPASLSGDGGGDYPQSVPACGYTIPS